MDFVPDVDPGVRKALVRNHEAILGKYLFDGTLLYNVRRLNDVSLLWCSCLGGFELNFERFLQPLEVFSTRRSDEANPVKITFRLVGEVRKEDHMYTVVSVDRHPAALEKNETSHLRERDSN